MDIDLLARLCEAPGAPGREERIRDVVIAEMRPYVDEITVDPMGSVAGIRRGGGGLCGGRVIGHGEILKRRNCLEAAQHREAAPGW